MSDQEYELIISEAKAAMDNMINADEELSITTKHREKVEARAEKRRLAKLNHVPVELDVVKPVKVKVPTRSRRVKPGYVYVMEIYRYGVKIDAVKIGYSNDPYRRAAELNKSWTVAAGYSFYVLAISKLFPSPLTQEARLHRSYKHLRFELPGSEGLQGRTEMFECIDGIADVVSNLSEVEVPFDE